MSVEGILNKIILDANTEAERITQEAKKEARLILKEEEKEADDYYEKEKQLLDEKYKKEKERNILNKRLGIRKNILKTRQRWMDSAFENAYKKLLDQPLSEYKKMILTLIPKLSTSKDEAIIFGKKGEEKDLKEIVESLNKKTDCNFTLYEDRSDFSWGFILKKGKIETDMSIDSIFNYKRMDLEQKAWEIFNADI